MIKRFSSIVIGIILFLISTSVGVWLFFPQTVVELRLQKEINRRVPSFLNITRLHWQPFFRLTADVDVQLPLLSPPPARIPLVIQIHPSWNQTSLDVRQQQWFQAHFQSDPIHGKALFSGWPMNKLHPQLSGDLNGEFQFNRKPGSSAAGNFSLIWQNGHIPPLEVVPAFLHGETFEEAKLNGQIDENRLNLDTIQFNGSSWQFHGGTVVNIRSPLNQSIFDLRLQLERPMEQTLEGRFQWTELKALAGSGSP